MLENEEEWNSFMSRVDEVGKVIRGLTSENRIENEIALKKADNFLGQADRPVDENKIYVKSSRTLINSKSLNEPSNDPNTVSQEAFMRSVEIDAKRRSEERRMDKESADRFMKRGNNAFREEDYESALTNFNKAIEKVRDSCLLYTNRALTYSKLGLHQRSLEDANMALKVNPESLKGFIYKAQALYFLGHCDESDELVKEACSVHPNKRNFIQGIQAKWKEMSRNSGICTDNI